ncbi:MAG TPA: YbaB/EbfC family nucleoid-associated protein [Planctomycetota bacterium]|jgi:DNA-binding YbaB/EbfC family protein|nr:YbaB/EbfC family nucleoid-associated protein [Planctomycetota bacterium]
MFPAGGMGKYGKAFEDMQKKLQKLDLELKERVVEAAAGGGMVKVKVNGAEEIVDIKIEKDVINPDDKGMLEDLVLAAANEGIKKAKKLRETELAKVTGMMMPGLI